MGAVLVAVVCVLSGCRERSKSSLRPAVLDKNGFVAVVGAGESDALWPVLRASAMRCAAEVGGIQVRTFAPDRVSQNKQSELIQGLLGPHLRGLCVQAVEPEAAAPLLDDVRASGVFVVTMLRRVPCSPRLHHCGPYESDVGKAVAQALNDALEAGGNVAVLRSTRNRIGLEDRYRGLADQLEKHPGLTVLRTLTYDGHTRQARERIQAFVERFPRLEGLAVIGDATVTELITPQAPLLPSTCRLVSTGPYPATWAHLAQGRCYALVATDYDRAAYKAVQWCLLAARRANIEIQTCDTGVHTVTADNLDAWKRQWRGWTQAPVP